MNKSFYALLFILEFTLINSKTISTNDLKEALSQAEPGDIIELKTGYYTDVPYTLKSGQAGKPIKIKSARGANVSFQINKNTEIFIGNRNEYVILEGPMYLSDALCGIKITDSHHINITGLYIYDTQKEGITITGSDNNYLITQ